MNYDLPNLTEMVEISPFTHTRKVRARAPQGRVVGSSGSHPTPIPAMSREAVMKIAFLGKAPNDRRDVFQLLKLAEKVMQRERRDAPGAPAMALPSNVILFPGAGMSGR